MILQICIHILCLMQMVPGLIRKNLFSDMKVEITASDADDIAIYAVKYDANMDRVYTSEIWWMNHNESELTRVKLGKNNFYI